MFRKMFERNQGTYTEEEQNKLAESCVTIVGVGGIGSWMPEILSRSGVGKFILIDGDKYEVSNKNRQIGALNSTIGLNKVEVMARRLIDINEEIVVKPLVEFIDETVDLDKIKETDVFVSLTDKFGMRTSVARIAEKLNKPICMGGQYGMVFYTGFFTDHKEFYKYNIDNPDTANMTSLHLPTNIVWGAVQCKNILDWLMGREVHRINQFTTWNLFGEKM